MIQISQHEFEILNKGILDKRTLEITYKSFVGEDQKLEINPLISGNDFLEHSFLFAYIPFNEVYYKFMFDMITSVSETKNHFEIPSEAEYRNSNEEEHYCFHKNFTKIYY